MDIILTEKQIKKINEISPYSGNLEKNAIYEVFGFIRHRGGFSKSEKKRLFKDYYKNEIGVKSKNISDEAIDKFFERLSFGRKDFKVSGEIKKSLTDKNKLLGFAYHCFVNKFNLSSGVDLKYYKSKDSEYFFFDPAFKIFVGSIRTDPKKQGTERVIISFLDDELIGQGYGIRMYATIITKVQYLSSDSTLYEGSYKMWSRVLPKMFNVWGVISGGDDSLNDDYEYKRKFVKISNRMRNYERFDYFIASSKHDSPASWMK